MIPKFRGQGNPFAIFSNFDLIFNQLEVPIFPTKSDNKNGDFQILEGGRRWGNVIPYIWKFSILSSFSNNNQIKIFHKKDKQNQIINGDM